MNGEEIDRQVWYPIQTGVEENLVVKDCLYELIEVRLQYQGRDLGWEGFRCGGEEEKHIVRAPKRKKK